jgi:hypothetical protein
MGYKFAHFWHGRVSIGKSCAYFVGLLVQGGANDSGHKMGEMRGAFIQLKPADNTMIGQILCYTRFGNA